MRSLVSSGAVNQWGDVQHGDDGGAMMNSNVHSGSRGRSSGTARSRLGLSPRLAGFQAALLVQFMPCPSRQRGKMPIAAGAAPLAEANQQSGNSGRGWHSRAARRLSIAPPSIDCPDVWLSSLYLRRHFVVGKLPTLVYVAILTRVALPRGQTPVDRPTVNRLSRRLAI